MKTFRKYYVVDNIAENIVGCFDAISQDMAKVVYKKSILENEKLKDSAEQFVLYADNYQFQVLETYDEILNNAYVVSV